MTDADRLSANPVVRGIWIVIGLAFVAIGGVGIVVPGLPTTVFFILAAACFTRSSPRLEAWVLDLPAIGPAVRSYRSGEGMPLRAKVLAITMLCLGVGVSAWRIDTWWIAAIVVAVGVIGVAWILRIPTRHTRGTDGSEGHN